MSNHLAYLTPDPRAAVTRDEFERAVVADLKDWEEFVPEVLDHVEDCGDCALCRTVLAKVERLDQKEITE